MPRDRQIALILPDTLQALGLEYLLNEYFPPLQISCFSSYEEFNRKATDAFDFFFICADLFLQHIDFFLPRRTKTVVVMPHHAEVTHAPSYHPHIIVTHAPLDNLIEQLEPLLATDLPAAVSLQENGKGLSVREIDVLQHIVRGHTNKEIANCLNISLNTVLTHRKNLTAKLGIKTVSGLTFYAIMNGYISGSEPDFE